MQLSIRSIGNSLGLILPKNVLEKYSLTNHDMVELSLTDEGILIKPTTEKKKRRTIQELFANYEGGFIEESEVDFGTQVVFAMLDNQ
jgi:antitoxin component of MazEF toxin-antitoxin module